MKIGSLAAAALLLAAGTAQAQVAVTEVGDAGQTLSTAQDTAAASTGVGIASISGRLSAYADADLFRIYIAAPSAFSARSTTNSDRYGDGGLDSVLTLFSASGAAIATNDDRSGTDLEAAFAAGNPLYASLAAGYYFLGIAQSGNDPVNANNQLLFQGYPGGDTTAVRGAAAGVTPTSLFQFNGADQIEAPADSGTYSIALTGVTAGPAAVLPAVPEPASWGMMIAGFAAAGIVLRRRRARGLAPIAAASA